jgi:hypothetical protein
MIFVLVALTVLSLLTLVTVFLTLSALGNHITESRALESLMVWHFRLTRRSINDQMLTTEVLPRLKKLLGEKKSQLEQAMEDLSNGVEPRIDLSELGVRRG